MANSDMSFTKFGVTCFAVMLAVAGCSAGQGKNTDHTTNTTTPAVAGDSTANDSLQIPAASSAEVARLVVTSGALEPGGVPLGRASGDLELRAACQSAVDASIKYVVKIADSKQFDGEVACGEQALNWAIQANSSDDVSLEISGYEDKQVDAYFILVPSE